MTETRRLPALKCMELFRCSSKMSSTSPIMLYVHTYVRCMNALCIWPAGGVACVYSHRATAIVAHAFHTIIRVDCIPEACHRHTHIHTNIQTLSKSRCRISCLVPRHSAIIIGMSKYCPQKSLHTDKYDGV